MTLTFEQLDATTPEGSLAWYAASPEAGFVIIKAKGLFFADVRCEQDIVICKTKGYYSGFEEAIEFCQRLNVLILYKGTKQ